MGLYRDTRGVGLLELMLGLIISSLVLLGVLRYVQVAERHMRITRAVSMVHTLVDSGYRWLETTVPSAVVPQQNIIPAMVQAYYIPASYARPKANPWHAAITMQVNGQHHRGRALHMVLEGLSVQDCEQLKHRLHDVAEALSCREGSLAKYQLSGDFVVYIG
jgi:hypothetical protein